jgi:hypothetical protein
MIDSLRMKYVGDIAQNLSLIQKHINLYLKGMILEIIRIG